MPSSAAGGASRSHVNAAAAAAAMSSDISRRNPQEDYELLQVRIFWVKIWVFNFVVNLTKNQNKQRKLKQVEI